MIKTNIKMRVTPEQARKVQEICFKNGIVWVASGKSFRDSYEWIYVDKEKLYCYSSAINKEIDADLFIKTNGTCELTDPVDIFEDICNQINEETYLAKYTSQPKDLESALKKIENLHIALKKKVEKNKNQALEISILLEQKKDLQEDFSILLKEKQSAHNEKHIAIGERNLVLYEIEILKKQRASESKGYCDLKKQIDDIQEDLSTKDKLIEFQKNYIKELKEKNSKISVSFDMTEINEIKQEAEKVIKECKDICNKKLSLKDGYISYLESKLK